MVSDPQEGKANDLVEKTEDIEDWVFNLAADIAIRPVWLRAIPADK